jgi:hypothetical protein
MISATEMLTLNKLGASRPLPALKFFNCYDGGFGARDACCEWTDQLAARIRLSMALGTGCDSPTIKVGFQAASWEANTHIYVSVVAMEPPVVRETSCQEAITSFKVGITMDRMRLGEIHLSVPFQGDYSYAHLVLPGMADAFSFIHRLTHGVNGLDTPKRKAVHFAHELHQPAQVLWLQPDQADKLQGSAA